MEKPLLGVGLIGCGSIGTALARSIDEGRAGKTQLLIMFDADPDKAWDLASNLSKKPKVAKTFDEFIEFEDTRLVIEAASQEAVRRYATDIIMSDKDLMTMSVGALIDKKLFSHVWSLIQNSTRKVFVPSGAIAGLDGLKAAALGRIEEVALTTRKSPESLKGAPYFDQNKIDLDRIKKPTLVYEGSALEACGLFPANVNVAASVSLAGIGPERTKVRIIAEPKLYKNVHEIVVKGEFGSLTNRTENVPAPNNPRTSYLAALSAIATLKRITANIVVGT